eukprot:s463_g2.t1
MTRMPPCILTPRPETIPVTALDHPNLLPRRLPLRLPGLPFPTMTNFSVNVGERGIVLTCPSLPPFPTPVVNCKHGSAGRPPRRSEPMLWTTTPAPKFKNVKGPPQRLRVAAADLNDKRMNAMEQQICAALKIAGILKCDRAFPPSPKGWQLHFLVLGRFFLAPGGEEWTAEQLRALICSLLEHEAWQRTVARFLHKPREQYCKKMQQNGTWGCEVAALLLCHALQPSRPVLIFNKATARFYRVEWEGQQADTIPIVLQWDADHYSPFHGDAAEPMPIRSMR